MISLIKSAWNKEARLWKVYWLLGVAFSIVFQLLVGVLALVNSSLEMLGILLLPYGIFHMVLLWKCSWNSDWRGWGYIVRFQIIVGPLLVIVGLIIGGVMVGGDMIKTAERRACYSAYLEAHGLEEGMIDIDSPEVKEFTKECVEKRLYERD